MVDFRYSGGGMQRGASPGVAPVAPPNPLFNPAPGPGYTPPTVGGGGTTAGSGSGGGSPPNPFAGPAPGPGTAPPAPGGAPPAPPAGGGTPPSPAPAPAPAPEQTSGGAFPPGSGGNTSGVWWLKDDPILQQLGDARGIRYHRRRRALASMFGTKAQRNEYNAGRAEGDNTPYWIANDPIIQQLGDARGIRYHRRRRALADLYGRGGE